MQYKSFLTNRIVHRKRQILSSPAILRTGANRSCVSRAQILAVKVPLPPFQILPPTSPWAVQPKVQFTLLICNCGKGV